VRGAKLDSGWRARAHCPADHQFLLLQLRPRVRREIVLVASGVFKVPDIDKIPEAVRAR